VRVLRVHGKTFLKGKGSTSIPEKGSGTHHVQKKTVTPKKVAANRANAKFSKGPRTESGKRAARLNAVKFAFFSEELVIPLCDGEEALEKYSSLLNEVQQELQPAGFVQTWFAEKIAETLWRFRRGTRAERGSRLLSGAK